MAIDTRVTISCSNGRWINHTLVKELNYQVK